MVLEDLFLNKQTDLLSNSYTFTYNTGDDEARFIVHFTPLGVDEPENGTVNIYSYSNNIYVNVPENVKGDIVVYNVMGQEIARKAINTALNTIMIQESANYIVKVISNDNIITQKVFVK